jgi:hypothetical protein
MKRFLGPAVGLLFLGLSVAANAGREVSDMICSLNVANSVRSASYGTLQGVENQNPPGELSAQELEQGLARMRLFQQGNRLSPEASFSRVDLNSRPEPSAVETTPAFRPRVVLFGSRHLEP